LKSRTEATAAGFRLLIGRGECEFESVG
jgi:hypothetical protein